MRLKSIDWIFIIFLCIITAIAVDFAINESHRVFIENLSRYPPFQNLGLGLIITFLACVIGNLLPFPTPYTFVLCYSSLPFINSNLLIPLLIGGIASLGCLVGEMGGYFLGWGVSKFISEKRNQQLGNYQKFLDNHPKMAPILLFLFGLTPLNDDLITVPLGIIEYDIKKTVFWCWLGKLVLMLLFSYNAFNLCALLGGESWILSIITLYVLTILLYFLLKLDIIDFLNKIVRNVMDKK